jgi:O-antigen ligase
MRSPGSYAASGSHLRTVRGLVPWVPSSRRLLAWGLLIGIISYGAGLVASVAPSASAAAVAVVFLGAMGAAHVRRLVPRRVATARRAPTASAAVVPVTAPTVRKAETDVLDDDLRFARLFYYSGMILIGQLTFRPKLPFTVSDWLFFISLCFAVSTFSLRRIRVRINVPPLLLAGIGLFAAGGLLSTFASDAPNQSIAVIMRLCYVTVIWFWLGTVVLRRLEHVWTAMTLWICSASLDGVGAIIQYFKGDVIPNGSVNWGRVSGFTENVSDLGGVTSAALVPALLLLLFQMRPGRDRFFVLGGAAVGLIVTGLILSGSVGSSLAALVAVAFWFGAQPTPARRLLALVCVATALLVLLSSHTPTYSQSAFDRIGRFGSGSPDDPNKTLDSRLGGYRAAVGRIEKNPFVGVGLDAESSQIAVGLDTASGRAAKLPVHNIILGTWYETGFFGLVGLILIFLSITREALSSIGDSSSASERALAVALASSFLAFGVFLLSEPALFTRYGWVSAALVLAVRAAQTERLEQAEKSGTTRLSLVDAGQ